MEKALGRFVVWSNVFYVVPLLAALYFHLVFVAFSLTLLILFSTSFHAFREREFVVSDIDAAILILFLDIALLYLGGWKPWSFILVLLLGLPALFIRFELEHGDRGSTPHGWWHLLSAAVTTICILSFALPF